jgi:hypothetical protein
VSALQRLRGTCRIAATVQKQKRNNERKRINVLSCVSQIGINDQEIAVEEIKSKLVDGEKKIRRNQLTVES